jgi:hypothetical protein
MKLSDRMKKRSFQILNSYFLHLRLTSPGDASHGNGNFYKEKLIMVNPSQT